MSDIARRDLPDRRDPPSPGGFRFARAAKVGIVVEFADGRMVTLVSQDVLDFDLTLTSESSCEDITAGMTSLYVTTAMRHTVEMRMEPATFTVTDTQI